MPGVSILADMIIRGDDVEQESEDFDLVLDSVSVWVDCTCKMLLLAKQKVKVCLEAAREGRAGMRIWVGTWHHYILTPGWREGRSGLEANRLAS